MKLTHGDTQTDPKKSIDNQNSFESKINSESKTCTSNRFGQLDDTEIFTKKSTRSKTKSDKHPKNQFAQKQKRTLRGTFYCRCCPLFTFLCLVGAILTAVAITALLMAIFLPNRTIISNKSTITIESTTIASTLLIISSTSTSRTTTTITSTTATSSSSAIPSSSVTNATSTTSSSSISTSTISTTSSSSTSITSDTSTTSSSSISTSTISTTSSSSTSRTTTTTSTTSTSTTTTTFVRPIRNITQPGDFIFGIYNTTAGGSTGGFDGRYPSTTSERPAKAIDGLTSTKYVNYGNNGTEFANMTQHGINSGFVITPSSNSPSVACGIRFATANDFENRDPMTVTLEGTNSTALNGTVWTLLYNGPSGLSSTTARTTYGSTQTFGNTLAFSSYRLLVTSQRGFQDSTQYSEVQIFGC